MTTVFAAYHLFLAKPTAGAVRVHLLTNEPAEKKDVEWRRMLAPWSEWAWLQPTRQIPQNQAGMVVEDAGVSAGDVVVVMTPDAAAVQAIGSAVEGRGARLIAPTPFPVGSRDEDFSREVSFFNNEFGGRNDVTGENPFYSPDCLRRLSATNCFQFYPLWAFESLEPRRLERGAPLKVLDVGCGPVSVLRWGALNGRISITGIDPLLPLYQMVLARHGLDVLPNIRCGREITGVAEELDRLVPEGNFDAVFTRNALDHTQKPALVLEQMANRLSAGGALVIEVATREGTRRNWDQLHKTDIYVKDDTLMYCHKDGAEKPLVSAASRIRLTCVRINTPDWLSCKLEKY